MLFIRSVTNKMYYDFLVFALLGGLGIAIVAGRTNAFVVCRRMSYIVDSLAHSAVYQEYYQ